MRRDVRFVPKADIRTRVVSLKLSVELIVQPDANDVVGEMAVRGNLPPVTLAAPNAAALPLAGRRGSDSKEGRLR